MAENDIYNSKPKYERAIRTLEQFALPPEKHGNWKAKYFCKNEVNLEYFHTLFAHFDTKDLSYARRNRLWGSFRLICHATKKDVTITIDLNQNFFVASKLNKEEEELLLKNRRKNKRDLLHNHRSIVIRVLLLVLYPIFINLCKGLYRI